MPDFAITLSAAKGITRIQYGNNSYNYVHPASKIPVVRMGFGGAPKSWQPLTKATISQTNSAADTLTLVDAGSAIGQLAIVAVAGVDSFRLKHTLTNLRLVPVTDFDVLSWTHSPVKTFSYDGTTAWPTGDQGGWEINSALFRVFCDTGQTTNPWQIWSADEGAIGFHFNNKGPIPRVQGAPVACEAYFFPLTSQGMYSVITIPPGGSYSWDLVVQFLPTRPDQATIVSTAPSAFSITRERFPMRVDTKLFPIRAPIGGNWFCQSPSPGHPNPICNPNGWRQADPHLALYDPNGSGKLVAETTGDVAALKDLAAWMTGRIKWCNYVTGVKCKGLSVIHWDLFDGEEFPQSGTSYAGDPRISRTQCAELWFRSSDFPVSIIQQCLDCLKMAYAGANPPTYLPNLLPGVGLRASHWPNPAHYTAPAPTQYSWQSEDDAVADLSGKIDRLYWSGFRVFYLDSFGNIHPEAYSANVLQRVMVMFPDVLVLPEAYKREDVMSAGRPWRLATATPWYAGVIWPGACGVVRQQAHTNPSDPLYAQTVEALKPSYIAGDCPFGGCYSGNPTELELLVNIYNEIAASLPKEETNEMDTSVTGSVLDPGQPLPSV